jgi:O-antigen biosynthesis protein
MNLFDDWGCGYYRCALPTYQCYGDLGKSGINVFLSKELHSEDTNYDSYVLHRLPAEPCIFLMQKAQQAGKKFILELDDDILNIPQWMPSDEFKTPKWAFKRAIEMADEIWVSTQPLAEAIGKPNKTYILPNLIDFNAFMPALEPATEPVRILWTGSMWHDRDLEQIVPAVKSILEEYGDKVQFLFWGCLPTAFAEFIRVPGQNLAVLEQKKEYGHRLLNLAPMPFRFYYDKLAQLRPYIGLAPLFDCKFNDSKSNLKYLEYSAVGAATIGTNLPPYQCIEDGVDGLLVDPEDSEGWYQSIKTLIDNRALRDTMAKTAKEKVLKQYSWQSQSRNDWMDAFKRLVR